MSLQRRAKMGRGPNPAPRWVGEIIARVLQAVGPTGLEFGRYSIGAQIAKPSSPYFMLHRRPQPSAIPTRLLKLNHKPRTWQLCP